jgi:protein-tyrosine phosphatase
MPFSRFDVEQSAYEEFRKNEIAVVVVLCEGHECEAQTGRDLLRQYAEEGYRVIHSPVPDFGVPEGEDFSRTLEDTLTHARAGRHVAIHCLAGVGRTGVFAACLARQALGLSGDDAIAWVRQYVPHAVSTDAQREFVKGDGN